MKLHQKGSFIIVLFFLGLLNTKASDLVYHNALEFKVIGRGFTDLEAPFDRLPKNLKGKIRQDLWDLGKNSAGIAIRFRTNSGTIGVNWKTMFGITHPHMAATGVRGLDLYCFFENHWQFMTAAKPAGSSETKLILLSSMEKAEREYMMYLPLYDGTVFLEIGIDSSATIGNPQLPLPVTGHPVVFYGSSITQGGCVSRPGMAYPAILERMLNTETINLGFSGDARMDIEILEAMLTMNPSCYVIDCIPNCYAPRIKAVGYEFIRRLLTEKKNVPVIMIENLWYSYAFFDKDWARDLNSRNGEWIKIYKQLKKEGYRQLYYISAESLAGKPYEGTVDGTHLTDLGTQIFSDNLCKTLKKRKLK